MEDLAWVLLLGLVAAVGFLTGRILSPKNKSLAQTNRWYEEELENLRLEVKRARAKTNYYMKGAIPQEVGTMDASNFNGVVDAIVSALPPNFRSIIAPWKPAIIKYVEQNPEMVAKAIEVVKAKVGVTNKGEPGGLALPDGQQQIDSL